MISLPQTSGGAEFVADDLTKKLILLFIFDKMEFPLTDASLSEIIMANPSWMSYMDSKDALFLLTESKLVYRAAAGTDTVFHITQDGRLALAGFYTKIPASVREEITAYASTNRQHFKRNQEYTHDYFKNTDGTHTVILRIKDHNSTENLLEIRIKTTTRSAALKAVAKWRDKAALVYESVHTIMLEDGD